MKRLFQLYAMALGVWVLCLVVASLIALLLLVGIPTSQSWHELRLEPEGRLVSFAELMCAWAACAGFVLVPAVVVAGVMSWWRPRGPATDHPPGG